MSEHSRHVVFLPGLKGTESTFEEHTDVSTFTGGNAKAVHDAVVGLGGQFNLVNYQYGDTNEERFAPFSKMAERAAEEIVRIDPDLIVASSVGAFIALETMMKTGKSADLLFLMPVYDVISKAHQLGGAHIKKILDGEADILPIPVESTEAGGKAGIFPLGKKHLTDHLALTEPENNRFAASMNLDQALAGKGIARVGIIYADNDPLCTEREAENLGGIFEWIATESVTIHSLTGGHGVDRTEILSDFVRNSIVKGYGLRKR